MNPDSVIAAALKYFAPARDFQQVFPEAEHWIVESKRQVDSHGWTAVYEWISRAKLFDRYAFWLVIAIEMREEEVSAREEPEIYVVEIEKVNSDNGWAMQLGNIASDDWKEIVASDGEFPASEFELKTDSPVEGFAKYWEHTSPRRRVLPNDGMALRAPLRFMAP